MSKALNIDWKTIKSNFHLLRRKNGDQTHSLILLNEKQKELLEKEFKRNNYPSLEEKDSIASELVLSKKKIEHWFKRRRKKAKNQVSTSNKNHNKIPPKNDAPEILTYHSVIFQYSGVYYCGVLL